jgi:hypothetical protein
MLELIDFYATKLLATGTADTVPSIYRREDQLNPSRNPSAPAGGQDPSNVDPDYNPWAPPLLFNPKQPKSGTLPSTWLTNEIGRAGVRAIELGIGSNNLRDRDMRRLLNTLDISARRFHELLKLPNSEDARADADVTRCTKVLTWNAGVMIRYLVEVGLGVRDSRTDKVDWYHEPGVRLALLQVEFASLHGTLEESRTNWQQKQGTWQKRRHRQQLRRSG